jgi:hypothetical protein
MKKSLAVFIMFFMVQMEASDREITCSTKDPKGKSPLPEKTPLLINETSSMLAQKKKFDLGIVETNLQMCDILKLDEDSRNKMFALQKSLLEYQKSQKCCGGCFASPSLCKSDHERNNEIVLGSDYKNLLAIANEQGWILNERRWTVNTEGIITRLRGNPAHNHANGYYEEDSCGSCGKCLMYSSSLPICAGLLFFLEWGCLPGMLGCAISKNTAFTVVGSLTGASGGCLAVGFACHECNTRGQDYERLQKLYAIIKPEK